MTTNKKRYTIGDGVEKAPGYWTSYQKAKKAADKWAREGSEKFQSGAILCTFIYNEHDEEVGEVMTYIE